MKRTQILFVASLGMLAAVFGCRSDDPNRVITGDRSVSSSEISGWNKVSGEDYDISLPAEFTTIDVTTSQFDQAWEEAKRANPNMASMDAQVRQARSSGVFRFIAVSYNPESPSQSINLVVEALPASVTLEQYEAASRSQLQAVAVAGTMQAKRETIGSQEFSMLRYRMVTGAGEQALVAYLLVAPGKAYIVTFGTQPSKHDDLEPFANQVMTTFHAK